MRLGMLIELRIRDYAVIDDLSLSLEPGLNVLSGETGAGKSIIVGALSLLVGERASAQLVRKGAERAVVEAVFDVSGRKGLEERLEKGGFPSEDGLLILRREVASEGRNRAWVNGSPATASAVGELGDRLVDIHGQHEHQSLLRASEQRNILDVYGGFEDLSAAVRRLHLEVNGLKKRVDERKTRARELAVRADFLRFQLEEIQSGELEAGEEKSLEEEGRRLEHARELAAGARELHEGLYAGEGSVSDRVDALRDLLGRLVRKDPTLQDATGSLAEAFHILAETGQRMGSYAGGIEEDPVRLEEIRKRQDLIFKLKRKYGPTVEDVLETGRRVKAELEELAGAPGDLRKEEEELARLTREFVGRAGELTLRRRDSAQRLQEAVKSVLPELGLPKAEFRVELFPLEEPGPGGVERVDFLASLNPGFDPGPLSRIASGGELSRIMLALKAILAEADEVPTLVFDEIDSGIGGAVALRVADKLRQVAGHHQVFVITHLPQLASRAHHQLSVAKGEVKGMASTEVRELTGEDRITEVARMLGGDPNSRTSRDHARELLESF
ncbi:MAG: DNA repair protein RecN [Longimicrobiales bacterium]